MTRRLALVAALAVASLGLFAGGSSARVEGKCIPDKQAGVRVENHAAIIIYCGHLKMTLKTGGKTTHYASGMGMCIKQPGTVNVGWGQWTQFGHTPRYEALLFVIPAVGDGTYRIAVLTIQHKGQKNYQLANHVKVVVTGKRSRGTFSGQFLKGAKFSGSFTCR
jgi:hypothetical protein